MGDDLAEGVGACEPKKATVSVFTNLLGSGPATPLENLNVKVNGVTKSSGALGVALFPDLEAGKPYRVEADLGKMFDQAHWIDSDDAVLAEEHTLKEGHNEIDLDSLRLPALKLAVVRVGKDNSPKAEPKIKINAVPEAGAETAVTSADNTGEAVFKVLQPGKYKFEAKLTGEQAETFIPPKPMENIVLKLDDSKVGRFVLQPKSTLRVEVARYDGKALSKAAKVTVKQKAPAKTLPAKDTVPGTDPNNNNAPLGVGEFKLVPGMHTITVEPQKDEADWKVSPNKGVDIEVDIKFDEPLTVRFTLTPYKKVQFIGFEARPGAINKKLYMGEKDAKTDIDARCAIMKQAITTAVGLGGKIDPAESTLKVFMAPEFFFRGSEGGYPVEKISSIVDETIAESVAKETIKDAYKHWLFVLGTAIGYLAHEKVDDDGDPLWWGKKATHKVGPMRAHRLTILDRVRIGTEMKVRVAPITDDFAAKGEAKWHLRQTAPMEASQPVIGTETEQNGNFWLKLQAPDEFQTGATVDLEMSNRQMMVSEVTTIKLAGKDVTRLKVQAPACKGLRFAQKIRWKVRQKHTPFDLEHPIVAYQQDDTSPLTDDYFIAIDEVADYKVGKAIELIEPVAAEVFNVALVRRGGPDPNPPPPGLRRAIVFKEYVSSIDFLGKQYGKGEFGYEDKHQIIIYGKTRTVLPTEGSRDRFGGTGSQINESEINKSGEGGGSVFSMDGITFGLEICLDHLQERLHGFYNGPAKPGDPVPQVYLIPSWGMTIGGGPTAAVPEAPIFNVDGRVGCEAVATLNVGHDRCEDHGPQAAGAYPYKCPAKDNQGKDCGSFLLGTAVGEKGARTSLPTDDKYLKSTSKLVVFNAVPIPDARNL